MAHEEVVAQKLQELRDGLERRGVRSSWGKLRVTGFDEKQLSVTLETSNYMFYQRFKTAKLVVPLLELVNHAELSLAHEDKQAVLELQQTIEREHERREQELRAREEARKREQEARRRREDEDRRRRERNRKRQEERRRRQQRDKTLRELIASVGFPQEEARKEISELSRRIDEQPSMALAFQLAAQHILYGRFERALPILDTAVACQRESSSLDAERVKETARQPVRVPDCDELPADADAGLVAASWQHAIERGDIGRAHLEYSRALRNFYLVLNRALNWPLGAEQRPAADTATKTLFSSRLRPQLLKESTAQAEAFVEEARGRGNPGWELEGHLNRALSYISRGLHDDVAAAVKAGQTLLEADPEQLGAAELERCKAELELLSAWVRLFVDEDIAGAVATAENALRGWSGLAEAAELWSIFVFATDQHVRPRLLQPFLTQLAERAREAGLPAAERLGALLQAVEAGSVAGESEE